MPGPRLSGLARQIEIADFTAEATPDGKAKIIQQLQSAGHRSPSLAMASTTRCPGSGRSRYRLARALTSPSAPLLSCWFQAQLAKVDEAFRLAASTRHIVRQNLFWAFFTTLPASRWQSQESSHPYSPPPPCSSFSISVVANSMRLSRRPKGAWPATAELSRLPRQSAYSWL